MNELLLFAGFGFALAASLGFLTARKEPETFREWAFKEIGADYYYDEDGTIQLCAREPQDNGCIEPPAGRTITTAAGLTAQVVELEDGCWLVDCSANRPKVKKAITDIDFEVV